MQDPKNIKLSALLLSKKQPVIRNQHFPFFVLDNFVSPEIFSALRSEFPTNSEMANRHQHGKQFTNNRDLASQGKMESFFENRPYWRRITEILGSQAFVNDVERLVRPYLFRHRLVGALRKWKMDGAKLPPFDRSVQLTYEWSGMPAGSYVNPHTDKAAKLLTFIWHFPEDGWRESDQGETLFMTAKKWQHNINWANFKLPFSELEILERSAAKPNRLVMFAKTGNSWHAVPPIQCQPDVYRRVFIFNYRYPVEVANAIPARAFESFHRRSQAPLFKDFPEENRKPDA